MASFAYSGDIGVDSIAGIKAAENASGIPHSVTSTYRPGSRTLSGKLSYHARRNAVDASSSPKNMQLLAAWIMQHYAPYTLELIHSGGPGYFVHNGKIVGASTYGAAVVNDHYDHVHWAITLSGLKAGGLSTVIGAPISTGNNPGCAFPIVIALAGITYEIAGRLLG